MKTPAKLPKHFKVLPPGCQLVRKDELKVGDITVNVKGEPMNEVIRISHELRSTGTEEKFIGEVPEAYKHLYQKDRTTTYYSRSSDGIVIKARA